MGCCGITCFIALLFLVANVYTMMSVDCKEVKADFCTLKTSFIFLAYDTSYTVYHTI